MPPPWSITRELMLVADRSLAGHLLSQHIRRHVHKLDLSRRADQRIRYGLPGRGAGDLLDHVGERFQLPDADGGDHVDSRRKQDPTSCQ